MYNSAWPLIIHIAVFAASGLLVAYTGTQMARYAKRLAHLTGLGQAITGALFLGASTSLSGIITSVTAAAEGHPELAASNAVGGIAAQTLFLAVADRVYARANLEHAAASDENMLQGSLLIALLSLPLLAAFAPAYTIGGIHPVSPLLILCYLFGQRLVYQAQDREMWRPRITEYTQTGESGEEDGGGNGQEEGSSRPSESLTLLVFKFVAAALALTVLGYLLATSGVIIAERTGLNETVLGGIFTAITTSFPELVTAVAAVKMGALTLAVSDIIGGNAFDTIFLAVADAVLREGSLYHAMGSRPLFMIMMTILMTSVLLLGLIRREKHGIANIGFESLLLVLIYAGGFTLIVTGVV
jgi:cation:H+ antiporter